METEIMDEIPAREEPVQVTDQIFLQDESTRVLEPEIQEDRKTEQQPTLPLFDLTKLSYELQQGYRIYVELLADSNRNVTWPFLEPVEAESLGLWDYYERIKEPMCFASIGSKFTDYKYESITEVVADIRLILENCYRYNGPDHWVSKLGQKLEKILEQKLALLNRSLRDKVTLLATMSLNQDLPLVAELEASGRRRSSRQNYLNLVNGENSSSLVNRVKIQEESEEKERRKQREKEKKEANQALLQDLVEWEKKELTPEIMNQLHSMWEIPSVGSFLYLVRNLLGLEDINLTEFELSFIYPNKSSLLAKIFTALLITPHQRKSLYKKPVMTFRKWESKLKEKLDAWYKLAEKESLYAVSIQYGIDLKFFDILGKEKNPLEEKSYLDLTLYQRVWLLKTLCDVCFHKDYDLREKVNSCDFMEQRELFLGNDAENHSFIYFPVFQTTDVRVYQHNQLEVPKLSNTKPKKEPSPPATPTPERKKAKKTPSKPPTPSRSVRSLRLRQLRGDIVTEDKVEEEEVSPDPAPDETNKVEPKPDPLTGFKVEDGFKLACYDIETLKALAEQYAEPPTPPKKRGRKPKIPPPRKRCEVDLHETLMALLQELEKYEGAFSRNYSKARIKIMKESLEPEVVEEPEEVPEPETVEEWGSELSDEDDGAKRDAKDEDFKIEDEYGNPINLEAKEPKLDNEVQSTSDDSENSSIKGILSTSPRHKRKRKSSKTENSTETQSGANCTIGIQTPNPRMKKRAKKWSPTKENVLINSKSVSSPAVVISAVSAEESVKAATVPLGVSVAKTLSTQSRNEVQSNLSPKMILVNSLSEALKRAKPSPSSNLPQDTVVDSSQVGVKNISTQGIATTGVTSQTSPSSVEASSSQAQNLRKRILVSPEGKAHEVKPCVTIVSTSTSTPVITLPMHPPIQRKTAVQSVTSVKGEVTTSGISATPIAAPRTQARVTSSTGSVPISSTVTTPGSHQRPNILSHSRKQVPGVPSVVVQQTTGNPVQGKVVIPSIPTPTVSHNHTYALPSASGNQGSTAVPRQQNPTAIGKEKASPTLKMVKIIPNSKQSNFATVSSLYAVPSTIAKPGVGVNTLPKSVPVSGQIGVKVAVPKASQGITSSSVLSHPKTMVASVAQVSTSQTKPTTVVSKGTVSLTAKPQASKLAPGQTKVVFIPAASVDSKSPLASFKPQTLTTTNGQSIYGYAVVVPPGSPQEVNAVISSAMRKPASVPAKPLNVAIPQKQQQMAAQGKVSNTVATEKTLNTSLSISSSSVSQTLPSVGTSSTPIVNVPVSVAQSGSNTTQPRPGVPTTTAQIRQDVPTITIQPRLVLAANTTQPRPGVPTITTQPRLLLAGNTTQPPPGVSTTTTQPQLLLAANTTQPPPGVSTTTTQSHRHTDTATSSTATNAEGPVPVSHSVLLGSITTHPRPGVPSSTTQPHLGAADNPQRPTISDTAVPVSNVSLGNSTTQPCTIPSTSQSPTINNYLLGSSTTHPRLDVTTIPQKPANPGVQVPVNSNGLLGSGATPPRDNSVNVQTTVACSSAQSSSVPLPKAPNVETPTKDTDSTPTIRPTDAASATVNGQNSCQPDYETIRDNAIAGNTNQIKNGPLNKPDTPANGSGVVTQKSEIVNESTNQPSNSAEPKEKDAKNIAEQISSSDVKSLPISSEKLSHSDKLTVMNEDQKVIAHCNGVSVHPTLKSIDSIPQSIKHADPNTPVTDVVRLNGIPDAKNSEAPSLCGTTSKFPAVTSN